MAIFLLSSLLIFSTFSFSMNLTTIPPLLSLWCNPSPLILDHRDMTPIETLVNNLTTRTPESDFTTLNTTFGQEWYTGLMQCRLGVGPKNCTLCAKLARNTISNLCRNSHAVSAWFDGCYVQISPMSSSGNAYMMNISHHSCSGRDKNQDPARFVPALGALLLQLRADVSIATHRGFSHREIGFENISHSRSYIYGLAECARSLAPQECNSCIEKAVEEVLFYCGGKNGGTLVHGPCLVRFGGDEFYHGGVLNSSAAGGGAAAGDFMVEEGANGGSRKQLVVRYWSGGVACFLVFVLLAWLLRRTVLNRGRVGTSGFADCDETAGKIVN